MPEATSIACKYESFSALVKINDPELLLDVFLNQLAPDYSQELQVEIYERLNNVWHKVIRNGCTTLEFDAEKRKILESRIDPDKTDIWFYDAKLGGWFCAYKPLSGKQFTLFLSIKDPDNLVDEEYIQLLFSFYCHQLLSLESTYRDSLTGLYNRRAFDQRMKSLLNLQNRPRRQNQLTPSYFVMLDIDYFKNINDDYGHLYGDEALAIVARIMTDSFRDYDLLFRYGGEEFTAVLMDIDEELCIKALDRFRQNIENHQFPKGNKVTVSLGYTDFNTHLTIEEIVDRADKALYLSKHNGRNQINKYSR
jgi:diguanylate cyclase (GGDEF)-like protein